MVEHLEDRFSRVYIRLYINLTEIVLNWKDYQIQKQGAKSCSKEGVHAENRYAMNYAIWAYRGRF